MDFYQLFNSCFSKNSVSGGYFNTNLVKKEGNATVNAVCDENMNPFLEEEWNAFAKRYSGENPLQYR
jgi:leucyl-tRNA synthetase